MAVDAKTGTERRSQQSLTRRRTDKREMVEVDLYRTCRRTFVYHYIDAVVLHRRIEVLLHDGTQTVYLVDEKHIVGFEGSEQTCKVSGFVKYRPRGHFEAYAKLIGDDVGESCLTKPRRTEEQHMVETLAAHLRCFHEDFEVRSHLTLSGEVGEA